MPRRCLLLPGWALVFAALIPRVAGADAPGGADFDEGAAGFWSRHFAFRLQVVVHDYSDLEIQSRRIKRNDLGLGFPQASVSAQNSAEHKSWRETSEIAALIFDPSAEHGAGPIGLLIGLGARQTESDFGTDSNDLEDERPLVVGGIVLPLGQATDSIRFDAEATVSHAVSEARDVDQVPGAAEELKLRTMAWSGRIVASYRATDAGWAVDEDNLAYEPYAGVMWHHVEINEQFAANTGAAKSTLEFDIETDSSSELRGIAGLRFLGGRGSSVDLETSWGSRVFGGGISLNLRF